MPYNIPPLAGKLPFTQLVLVSKNLGSAAESFQFRISSFQWHTPLALETGNFKPETGNSI
jgi:hypothetical protein